MKILLTFDHELYFGQSGSVEKCIIQPGERLLKISKEFSIPFNFFFDAGLISKLEEQKENNIYAKEQHQKLLSHLISINESESSVYLHVHPHWEDAVLEETKWIFNTHRYKLSDFNKAEAKQIILKYAHSIQKHNIKLGSAFRAGGWCIQPFSYFKQALIDLNIRIDSSVIVNEYKSSEHYEYDFRSAPDKCQYRFEDNPAEEDHNGSFLEIPVSSRMVNPTFYWILYVLGRLNPRLHKPIGDGLPIMEKGFRQRILTQRTRQYISVDGYNARLLNKSQKQILKDGKDCMVVLSHPKAMSEYSFNRLHTFIKNNCDKHEFVNYEYFLKSNV
ncbi:MAG TPA: hypothetical protein PKH65_00715 [Bacteroidia bacterium]|nr:hypothetical protein [Bacteroidia bacterium]HNT79174.1 hypothetical protein [Bacteroidia bacterium]